MTTSRPINDDTRPNSSGMSPAWDGGWYVFEHGQVKGPLSAQDVFGASEASLKNPTLMVSRKGFTQWYPVKDFAAMYHMASRYTDHLGTASSQKSLDHPLKTRHIGPDEFKTPAVEKNAVAHSIIREAQKDIASTPVITSETMSFGRREKLSETHIGAQSEITRQTTNRLSRTAKKRLLDEERRQRKFAAKQAKAARKAAKSQSLIPQVSFEQLYLETASRLRLGKIVSPFLASCFYMPFSFGGYWWAWFTRVSEEVSWHLNGSSRMNFILPVWMCLVPGAHLILAYLVARMVMQIERQNGYQTIDPGLATLLAVFPPFYIAHIQSALNRHWRLHVYHGSVQK